MKIVLTTENVYIASRLRDKILRAVKGELPQEQIETWSYAKAAENIDVIFNNLPLYTDTPQNNVVFRVELNGENIIFSTAYWTRNPQPEHKMYCIHVGRLTEMLLTYFSGDFSKFSILEP